MTTSTVFPSMGGEEEIPLHFQPLRPDKIQPKLMEKNDDDDDEYHDDNDDDHDDDQPLRRTKSNQN